MRRATSLHLTLVLLALAPVLGGWSCERGTLTIHLLKSPGAPGASQDEQDPLPDPDEAIAAGREPLVTSIRIRIEGQGMDVMERSFPYAGPGGGRAEVPDVPTGERRVITVEGVGPKGQVYSRGTTIPLELRPGRNYLNLYIGRVNRFSTVPVPMRSARAFHAAVTLGDSRVVLVGGASAVGRSATEPLSILGEVATADVLDATSASFDTLPLDCSAALASDCLRTGRAFASATAIPTGVLVVGGESPTGVFGDAELFDTGRRLFLAGGSLGVARSRHAAASTPDGVILFGGRGADGPVGTVEGFFGDRFAFLASMAPREALTATTLADGRVLLVGGRDADGEVTTAEIFDGSSVVPTGSLAVARAYHTATLLQDGRVLVLGGLASGAALDSAEVYDPETGTFSVAEAPGFRDRWAHASVLLDDGRVLVTGGFGGGLFGGARREAEILDPRNLQTGPGPLGGMAVTRLPGMNQGRAGHSGALLRNGLVVFAGGVDSSGHALDSAEVFVVAR